MATPTDNTVPKIDWLYPELLSKDGLIEIFSQRFVKLPDDTTNTAKEDLLELYYQYVLPKPQRKYRANRRGRDMARKQILQAKRRRITGPDSSEPPAKKAAVESARLLTSFQGLATTDRLKPPPSTINFEKKVIKLGTSKPTNNSQGVSASTAVTVTGGNNDTTSPTAPRIIKLNRTPTSSNTSSLTSPKPTVTNKTVKLINSHLDVSGDSAKRVDNGEEQAMEVDIPDPGSAKKVKIKKISWP